MMMVKLGEYNIERYIKQQYDIKEPKITAEKKLSVIPLLQNDYGEKSDCAIVSAICCAQYIVTQKGKTVTSMWALYKKAVLIAKTYGYNGEKGTFAPIIWKIYQHLLDYIGVLHPVVTNYLKGFNYNFNTIKKVIDRKQPILLTVKSANGGYYQNHTMTVCGYRVYNNKVKFLLVQDNWTKSLSMIDYSTISRISAIVY